LASSASWLAPNLLQTCREEQRLEQVQAKPDTTPSKSPAAPSPRADAHYNFAMGHLFEQQFEATSQPEFATQAIDATKRHTL
jgi:hypothetical protein